MITTARAVLAGTTYAMANITSVRQLAEPSAAGFLGLLAAGGAALGIYVAIDGLWRLGLVILAFAALLGLAAYFARKRTYWVRIGTAGAETNAVSSDDPVWVARVVGALNDAIVSRG